MPATRTTPVLKPEDHELFLEHAYVVLKNAVPTQTIAAAVALLESGTFRGVPGAADDESVKGAPLDACVTDTILDAIGELFGAAYPFPRRRHAIDMPRPYQPSAEWQMPQAHVDDDYPSLMPQGWALGMFIFLTPVRERSGAFVFAPGSPYRPVLADNPEWLLFVHAASGPAPEPLQEFLAEPGDVLLFHHLMGHSGTTNVSDPQTRHALLSRFHPERRIVPGAKPFDAMATIEKANSTRYLAQRFGPPYHVPELVVDDRTTQALRAGFGASGGIAAYAAIRMRGLTHLFYVAAAEPAVIHHVHSRNWVDWEAGEAVERLGEPIRALSLFQQGSDILLFVGTTSTAPKTRILMSHDLHTWSPLTDLPHSVCGAGHFTTDYGSKHARGNVAFVVSPSQPAVVQARWGDEWADAAAWTNQAPVAEVGPGSAILDAFVKPTLGEAQFALIADVRQRGAPDEPAPFYALSQDSARYEALQPLAFATPTPPRQIRVYARARHFWLVTYLRRLDGRDRLFWGTIDWEKEPLTLEEIDMAAALDEAFYVVGLK